MARKPVILLVEDDADDATLIQRTLRAAKMSEEVVLVNDGPDAIRYFNGELEYANREKFPIPRLVLLDLKLPTMSGFEVLKRIRSRAEFDQVKIVVLTASTAIQDANRAYKLGANSFLVKPIEAANVQAVIEAFLKSQSRDNGRASETKSG
jgi:CheY-like chemotaxis protein